MELRCSCGTPSHSLPRSVFSKTLLGPPKNFFKCVKAKPDCLSVFRAGTSSRHARKHKTPTEGTAPESIDRFPEINGSGIPGSLPFHEKYVAIRKKVFGSTPFSKGVAGCRAGSPAKSDGIQGGEPCKEGWIAGQELCEERRGLGEKTMERMFFRRHTLFWKHCIEW